MSHRVLTRDAGESRRQAYRELETSGKAQEALWEALETLASQGIDLGPKAAEVLSERAQIKRSMPK